jgi:hypothetical protein
MECIGNGRVTRRRIIGIGQAVAIGIATLFAACSDDAPSRISAPGGPNLAKSGGTGPSVNSTNPSYAHRDTTLDVHVLGSGFSSGAKATWSLGGDTTLVRVNSTTYVSSGDLIANVTVPAGAPLATYDVAVTLLSGKKGVGSELFEVTAAEPLVAAGRVTDVADQGGIVGGVSSGFYYDDTCKGVDLGGAEMWGVDPQAAVLAGRGNKTDGLLAVAWIRTGACAFTRERLPNPGGAGGSAKSVARTSAGAIIVGGFDVKSGKPSTVVQNRPALWTRSGSSWLGPTFYSTPNGNGEIWRINGSAMAVGRSSEATAQVGYIWNSATDYTAIDGLPFSINEAGTVAVGNNNAGQAVYWTRNPSTGRWDTVGRVLAGSDGAPAGGTAFDVNDAGIIVGRFSFSPTKLKASVWRLDMSVYPPVPIGGVQVLSGLGPTTTSEAASGKAITNVLVDGYYIIAGTASESNTYAVRWRLPP